MTLPEKNIGICLARIVFSFLVVCCHFYSSGAWESIVKPLRGMAVPVFFIIAFYFSEQSLSRSLNVKLGLKRRLSRILLPLWFWGAVLAPLYAATVLLPWNGPETILSVARNVVLQMVFGHVYDHPLWFLFVLAILTTLQGLLRQMRLSSRMRLCSLLGLVGVSYWLQYSGLNAGFWNRFDFSVRFPMGRIAECIPFAAAGIILFHSGLVTTIHDRRTKFLVLATSVVLSWPFECLPWTAGRGFEYAGLFRLRAGIGLFLLFAHFPISWLSNWWRRKIEIVSSYSLGVFCIHIPIGFFAEKALAAARISSPDIFLCLAVYFFSIVASWSFVRIAGPKASRFVQ